MKTILVKLFLIGSVLITLTGCNIDKSQPNVELIQDMMESPALKPQEFDATGPNNGAMRLPPEGTQPVGFEAYRYSVDVAGSVNNKNPLAGQFSEEILKTGMKYYTIHCSICHGANGEGGAKLSVAETMALKPPALVSDKVKAWTDGQIYHVITVGQGVMGPYASHVPAQYRWQVVNYIRHLEGKGK